MLFDLPLQRAPDAVEKYGAAMTTKDERPSARLDVVKRAAASVLAPKIVAWLKAGGDAAEEAEIADELAGILDTGADGYQLAKRLDNKGWDCDSELVDLLDTGWHALYEAHQRLLKAWVVAHDITLTLPLGALVQTPRGDGEIREMRRDTARYLVYIEALGHVRSGIGTRGIYFDAEEIQAK